jgi:hypothetical protein
MWLPKLLILFYCLIIYGNEAENLLADVSQSSLIVSLGSNCNTAHVLKNYGLRTTAFPFDWLLTLDEEKFIELLDNDFLHFLDKEYFIKHNSILVHKYYNIEFRHEVEGLERLIEKHTKRIARFRQLDHYPGKVFFIRNVHVSSADPALYGRDEKGFCSMDTESALRLNAVLKKRFPKLDFTLVTINVNETSFKTLENVFMLECLKFTWDDLKKLYDIFLTSSKEVPFKQLVQSVAELFPIAYYSSQN